MALLQPNIIGKTMALPAKAEWGAGTTTLPSCHEVPHLPTFEVMPDEAK